MGWCHDCVGISSSLQHKELALTMATMVLFVILLLVCHGKQGWDVTQNRITQQQMCYSKCITRSSSSQHNR